MAAKRMLLITTLYPYGQGEAFVEAELDHVSRYFGHIEVAPISPYMDAARRHDRHPVNLGYADKRWGLLRVLRVACALLPGLVRYRWAADFGFILTHAHKLDNLKELGRALYRARMFERFLVSQARAGHAAYDVIYSYWLVPEILGAIQFRKTRGGAARIVSRAHGGDLYEDRRAGGYAGLRRRIAAGIDEVYCISEHGTRYLAQCFPTLTGKFHTARLGVDDPGFLNRQPDGGPLQIVSCAFVVFEKRLHLIVDAIARLLEDDPALQVRWTHIGDGPLLDEVRAYAARRLGARAQAIFKGYMTQAELKALYRDEPFDVIVNVSDNEGIPVSLMEASSAAIPMVATDVGGSAEIVNASNGVLIPADADTAAIAAAILRFNDRGAARAYRAAARQSWDARFNAATNYRQFGRRLANHSVATLRAGALETAAFRLPQGRDPAAG